MGVRVIELLGSGQREQFAEVPVTHTIRQHGPGGKRLKRIAKALVRSEKEGLIPAVIEERNHDRTTHDSAELVVAERCFGGRRSRKPALRIQRVVLQVVVNRSVDLVATGRSDLIDMNTKVVTVLCCVVAVLHLDRTESVRVRHKSGSRSEVVHDADAIKREAVIYASSAGAARVIARRVARKCRTAH